MQLELDLQEVVDDMTIEQRIDCAIHPVTTTAQYIECVEDRQAFIFLDDQDNFSICVTLDIDSANDTRLNSVSFDDMLINPTSLQRKRLEWLATDIYRCSIERGEYDGDCYDQSTYGFTNSDWLSV